MGTGALTSSISYADETMGEAAEAMTEVAETVDAAIEAPTEVIEVAAIEEAAPAEAAAPTVDKGDTAWMMVATLLVILMTVPGLALFYGGLVRSKNMLSILMQVLVVFSLISVAWAVYGYSLSLIHI